MVEQLACEEMASTCHVEASSGSHVFKIAGYSLTQGMGVGQCLQSSTFTVAGHDWAIVFYPDGHCVNDTADHVSVFVTLVSDMAGPEDNDGAAVVRAHVDFGLLDQRRSPPVIKKESRLSHGFAAQGASAGYARFMSKAEVASSGLVHDDCLAVRCMVHVVRVREGEVAGTVAAVPPTSVLTNAYRHVATRTWPALKRRFGTEDGLAFLFELLLKCLMVYLNKQLRDDDDCSCDRERCRCKCGGCCCND
ncbi:hypothetical protein EJB05_18050, partial [Eragrostis curvula]